MLTQSIVERLQNEYIQTTEQILKNGKKSYSDICPRETLLKGRLDGLQFALILLVGEAEFTKFVNLVHFAALSKVTSKLKNSKGPKNPGRQTKKK